MTLYLRLITTKEDNEIARKIVESFHSYKPAYRVIGRRINWLIERDGSRNARGTVIGFIGIASAPLFFPKCFIEYLGIEKEYDGVSLHWINLGQMAANWRFAFNEKAEPRDGSKTLSLLAKIAPVEWEKKYGEPLELIITLIGKSRVALVDPEKAGTTYKAANWIYIGKTSGNVMHSNSLRRYKEDGRKKATERWAGSHNVGLAEVKLVFVLPLKNGWKERLLKKKERA